MVKAERVTEMIVWVLPDRSNGNSHERWPTYIWVRPTRAQARAQRAFHKAMNYATLGAPIRTTRTHLRRLGYRHGTDLYGYWSKPK